jgi:O-antigen ligase
LKSPVSDQAAVGNSYGFVAERYPKWCWTPALGGAAYTLCLAALVFTSHDVPSRVYVLYFLLPLAGVISWSFWREVPMSTVMLAVAVYLGAMVFASYLDPLAERAFVWRQFRISLLILIFLYATALLMLTYARFFSDALLALCLAVAASAAFNIGVFLTSFASDLSQLPQARLIAVMGMQDYANSTNISATYAVFAVGAVALLARADVNRLWRALLACAAVVLLLGVALTQARSAGLAVVAGLGVLVLTGSRRMRILAAVAAALGLLLLIAVPEIADIFLARGVSHRPDSWRQFSQLIAERPLFGHGSRPKIGAVLADGAFHNQAHNVVLSAWFRGGIAAALAMLFVLGGGLYWATRYWRLQGEVAPLCMMVAIATAGMFDYQILITYPAWPWLTFWLPFGLCVGAEMSVRKHAPRSR